MSRSFRLQLALRFAATMALGSVVITVASLVTLRIVLDREIDRTISSVASIQAASVTDSPTGEMRFHEWELTPAEADSLQDLIRYAQIWQSDGLSLLRSRYMTEDLPLDSVALEQAADGELLWREAQYQGVPVRSLYYPLERFGPLHQRHVLQVGAPLAARNELLRRVALYLILVSAVVVTGSYLGSQWLAGRALRPIREIIDQAEEIEAQSLKRGITAYADTAEYQRLVSVLDNMLGRLQAAFEAQRRFTADASHELRSPLTAMRGELELALRRERDTDEYQRVIGSTLEEVLRLSRTAEDLLTLARSDAGAVKPQMKILDLSAVAHLTADRLRTRAEERGVGIQVMAKDSGSTTADSDLLERATWNLVDNAVRHAAPGSEVTVTVRSTPDHATLEVADRGPGLGDTPPERVFERFYRADTSRAHEGGGTGLGLAITLAIVEAHDGSLKASNRPGGGAVFTLALPVAVSPEAL